MFDIPNADQVRLAWKGLIECVVPSSLQASSLSILTVPQFSRCSSWCGRRPPVTARPVLKGIKNRYWPLWYLLWSFVGWCSFRSTHYPPRPCLNFRTASWNPGFTKTVCDPHCGSSGHHSYPHSLDVRSSTSEVLLANTELTGVTRLYGFM